MFRLSTLGRFLRRREPWPDGMRKLKRGEVPVYGVDYFTPPEIAAAQGRRRAGRRIIMTGVDEDGCATFAYEGDAPEYVEPKAKAV